MMCLEVDLRRPATAKLATDRKAEFVLLIIGGAEDPADSAYILFPVSVAKICQNSLLRN